MSLPSLRPVPSASWKRILASSGADCQGRRQRLCRVLLSGWPSLLIVGGTLALCLHLWGLLRQGHEAELEHARARAEQRATQLARAVRLEIDSSLRSLDIALTYLGEKYDDGPDEFARAANQMIASYPQGLVQGVAVYGLDGSFRHLTGVFPGRAVPADLLRPRGRDDRGARLDLGPSGGADGADETITLVVPLHRHGVPVVSIGIALRPLALSAHLAALRGQPQDALAVFRPDGRAVAHSRSVEASRLQVPTDRPFLQANRGEEGIFRAPSARDGRPLLLAWQRLQHWPLSVVAAIDEDAEYHLLNQQRDRAEQHASLVSALALCFALGVAVLIVRVRHGEARSTAMFRRAKLPMLLVDPVGTCIVEANDAAADFYGLDRQGMSGLPLAHIQLPRRDDSTEMPTSGCEYDAWQDGVRQRHWRADHAPRDVEIRCGSLQLGGRPLLYCTVQDITERCAAEDAAAFEANRHAALLATASDGIHILDEDGHLVQFSPSFIAMLGYSDEEAHTLHVACWDVDRTIQDMKETVRQRIISPRTFEARHRRKDGRVLDVEITSRGFTIGGRSYLYASSRDITARKAAEVQLRLAAAAFEAQEGIVVTDKDNRVVRVNRAFTEITGYSADEALGRNPSFLSSGRHDAAFYAAMWEGIRSEGHWKGEIYNRRKSGEVYPEWLTISAVRAADGVITHHVAMLTDISERKAAEREVMRLAFYDPLTQLPNRRLLYDRLQQALAKSARTKLRGAALFIDLDNFKALNDTRGHSTGDLLLQQVAARLQRGVREDDTVARVGADEFVVLLENISPVEDEAAGQARQVAQKLLAGFLEPLVLGGHSLHTTASIGIALFDGQGGGVDETLKRAGLAVDEAKARGRNEMSFFDPVMQALAVARVRLEAELRHGLGNKELVLFYQPQVDRQGRIRGAETLVRWQHPRLGLLQPVDFIDVAERAGLIGPLGLAVLEGACETLVQWSAHPALHHLVLAVNVSALQFSEESFVDEVRRVLEASGADPHRLELELTESALVDDVDAVIAKMHAIKRMGIGLALDDFGTGYSSLSYLSRLPLDQLKIDRSFVKDIEVDDHAAVICSATINLAHSLSLTVVAEGVETEAQRELLSSTYPCDRMQGYRFGRPMTAQAFEEAVLTSLQESESILA